MERRERGASVALSQQCNSSQTSSSFLEHHQEPSARKTIILCTNISEVIILHTSLSIVLVFSLST